jgi:predicted dehydrogenase
MNGGKLGEPVMGSAYVKWYRPPEYYAKGGWRGTWALDGGGALMNQSIHTIDMLRWLMGQIVSVFAFTGRRYHMDIETEDSAVVALRFANGAFGVIEASTAIYPGYEARIELAGSNGSMIVENGVIKKIEMKDASAPGNDGGGGGSGAGGSRGSGVGDNGDNSGTGSDAGDSGGSGGARNPMDIGYTDHMNLIDDFSLNLIENRPFWLDCAEARKTVEVIIAIYNSAETGKVIEIA